MLGLFGLFRRSPTPDFKVSPSMQGAITGADAKPPMSIARPITNSHKNNPLATSKVSELPLGSTPDEVVNIAIHFSDAANRMRKINAKSAEIKSFFAKIGFELSPPTFKEITASRGLLDSLNFSFQAKKPIQVPNVPTARGYIPKPEEHDLYNLRVRYTQSPPNTPNNTELSFELVQLNPDGSDRESIGSICVTNTVSDNTVYILRGLTKNNSNHQSPSEAPFRDFATKFVANNFWLYSFCAPLWDPTLPQILPDGSLVERKAPGTSTIVRPPNNVLKAADGTTAPSSPTP